MVRLFAISLMIASSAAWSGEFVHRSADAIWFAGNPENGNARICYSNDGTETCTPGMCDVDVCVDVPIVNFSDGGVDYRFSAPSRVKVTNVRFAQAEVGGVYMNMATD